MIDEEATATERPLTAAAAPLLREFGAGVAAAIVSLAFCQSYGALIFSGPLQPWLSYGVVAALVTGGVTATIIGLGSGLRTAIGGPEGNVTALLAAMMAGLAPTLQGLPPGQAALLAAAALFSATLLSGGAILLAGWQHLSKFVRFIPYPVVAGFLASTGYLILSGAVLMATGVRVSAATLPDFAHAQPLLLLLVTFACGGVLYLLTERFKQPLTLPLALLLITVVTNLGLRVTLSPAEIHTSGLMFEGGGSDQGLVPPLATGAISVDWSALLPLLGDMASIALMSIICILINSTSLELATGDEIDLDRELRLQGSANIVTALLGGFIGYVSVSRTTLNQATGGSGRMSGVMIGLVSLLVLVTGGTIMSLLPRFLMGGLLLVVGGRMFWQWAIASRAKIPLQDWAVVLGIVLITATSGFIAALLVGIIAACVMFAIDVSRTRIISHEFGIDERCSSVLRSAEDMQLLALHGGRVQVIELTGYIFFGSAYGLQQYVQKLIEARDPTGLIFDFARVSGIDSSAGAGFGKIARLLRQAGIRQIVSGVTPAMERRMRAVGALPPEVQSYANLDAAVEDAEGELLDSLRGASHTRASLRNWLTEALGDDEQACILAGSLLPAEPAAADGTLCHQGDPTDSLLFVESGRISVMLERPGQERLRVRVFGAHTIVGEVGFFLDAPRTATLQVEEEAVVWQLNRPAFARLKAEQPEVLAALFTYVIRLQSERLAFATRQIAALQR